MPKLTDYELEEQFKNSIDETAQPFAIWGMEYQVSRVIQELDPIAFRQGFLDWADSLDDCDGCELNPLECECEE